MCNCQGLVGSRAFMDHVDKAVETFLNEKCTPAHGKELSVHGLYEMFKDWWPQHHSHWTPYISHMCRGIWKLGYKRRMYPEGDDRQFWRGLKLKEA